MRYYLIAGEKSGDLHASELMQEIRKIDNESEFRGIGGETMASAGLSLLFHFREINISGFTKVLFQLLYIQKKLRLCKLDVEGFNPHALILIDSAGFNLRVARFAAKKRVLTYYFIPPKIWAWGSWRAKTIRECVTHAYTTTAFEQRFYENMQIPASFYGSQVFNRLRKHNVNKGQVWDEKEWEIALLPGSRKQEIKAHMPILMKIAERFQHYSFVIGKVEHIEEMFYAKYCKIPPNVSLKEDIFNDNFQHYRAAVVCSGTASLECGYFQVPQVVIYRTNWANYYLGKWLAQVSFLSLINLMAGCKIIEELIQSDLKLSTLEGVLKKLIKDENYREGIVNAYSDIVKNDKYSATYRLTAESMISKLRSGSS